MKLTSPVLRAAVVAGVAALALAGCSGGGGTSGTGGSSGSITIWADATKIAAMKSIVPGFEKQYKVKVNLVQKPGENFSKTVIQQAPTGKGPDVVEDAFDSIGNYADNGVIAPLTIAKESDFQKIAINAVTYQDKVWGMPISLENVALYRNTDLVPNAPTSWQEMLDTGNKLVADGKAKYGFFVQSGTAGAEDPYHLYPLLTSYGIGAYALKSDGSYDTSKLNLGGESGAKFATALAEWGKNGTLNPNYTYDIGLDAFSKGQAAFFLSGPWALPTFEGKVKFAVDPIPSPGGETAAPFVGGQAFLVSKYSKNQLIANKFVADYLATKSVQLSFFKTGLRAPALQAAADDSTVTSNTNIAAFGKVAAKGLPFPNTTQFSALFAAMGQTEGAIVAGKSSNPAADWQAMVDKYQALAK